MPTQPASYQGTHRTLSSADNDWPHITTVNACASVLGDDLYVSLTDAVTHNGMGVTFRGDAKAAIVEALRLPSFTPPMTVTNWADGGDY